MNNTVQNASISFNLLNNPAHLFGSGNVGLNYGNVSAKLFQALHSSDLQTGFVCLIVGLKPGSPFGPLRQGGSSRKDQSSATVLREILGYSDSDFPETSSY